MSLKEHAMSEALRSQREIRILPNPGELEHVAGHLEGADPREIIEWAVSTYGPGLALSASFGGGEGMALVDMISKITNEVTILTIDTGFIFRETAEFREEVMRRYKLPLEVLRPALTIEEQVEHYGEQMRTCTPDLCCQVRKIEPLQRALSRYDAWMTGIRRDQTPERANTKVVAWEERYGAAKVAPLAHWTDEQVWDYVKTNDVPVNPLLHQGYKSIGCEPQTRPVHPDEDARAGRWVGLDKNECGLHWDNGKPVPASENGSSGHAGS
jgi:phosphoadenosine phosphosulfate reductase